LRYEATPGTTISPFAQRGDIRDAEWFRDVLRNYGLFRESSKSSRRKTNEVNTIGNKNRMSKILSAISSDGEYDLR
jgi:hypothetical protein